jgi:predicted DNA-binding transcriptional regulator YafY
MAERHEKLTKSLAMMLSLSSTRSGVTLRELMAEHDVGLRTLQRMLRAIEQVSGPLEDVPWDGREKRWRLRPIPLARALAPTASEVAEVELAAERLRQEGLTDRADLLRLAASRIRAATSPENLRRMEPDIEALLTAEGIAARPGPVVMLPEGSVHRLRRAILSCQRIKLHYRRADGSARWYVLEPYGLLYGRRPYLLALRPEKPDVAVWRLDRILDIEETDEGFRPREGCDVHALTADCFGIWREPAFDVELHFAPEAASDARAWRFHGSQMQEVLGDGSLVVRFRAGGTEEMVHHLATWGSAVTVVRPEALRERLAAFARAVLVQHGAEQCSSRSGCQTGA